MAHWRAVLPNPILTVALSDWVSDFDATLARVLAHLDLPPDPACARFHESDRGVRTVSRAQVRQPVNARGLGRWRTYAARTGAADRRVAGGRDAGGLTGRPRPFRWTRRTIDLVKADFRIDRPGPAPQLPRVIAREYANSLVVGGSARELQRGSL